MFVLCRSGSPLCFCLFLSQCCVSTPCGTMGIGFATWSGFCELHGMVVLSWSICLSRPPVLPQQSSIPSAKSFWKNRKTAYCALRAFLLKMLLCFCVFFAPSPVVCCGGRKAWPGPEDPHKNSQKPVFNFWKLALARWSFCAPNVVFACIFGQFVPRSEMHCF